MTEWHCEVCRAHKGQYYGKSGWENCCRGLGLKDPEPASLADAQAEIARLRGALEEARRRVSDDLLGADSQDRRIMEEIDDAITAALESTL